jgi:curved DNA-binding protein
MTDYYQTLGVSKTATADEIKKAYRGLASKHHPDRGGDTQQFQKIQAAYQVLGDPQARNLHDQQSVASMAFFDLHGMFGQTTATRPRTQNIQTTMWVTLSDIANNQTKALNLVNIHGTTSVRIAVPVTINDGDHVRYQGIAPNGHDLIVGFRIQPDPNWHKDGSNLHTQCPVSVWQLITGAELELSTLTNTTIKFAVLPGTQPCATLRLKGQGLPDTNGAQGDILVKLQPFFPGPVPESVQQAVEQCTEIIAK